MNPSPGKSSNTLRRRPGVRASPPSAAAAGANGPPRRPGGPGRRKALLALAATVLLVLIFDASLAARSLRPQVPAPRAAVVRLDSGQTAAQIVAQLIPFTTVRPQRLFIVLPTSRVAACAGGTAFGSTAAVADPGGPPPLYRTPAGPGFCSLLPQLMSWPQNPPVLLIQGQAPSGTTSTVADMMLAIYGPTAELSGGPSVFLVRLPGRSGLSIHWVLLPLLAIALAVSIAASRDRSHRRARGTHQATRDRHVLVSNPCLILSAPVSAPGPEPAAVRPGKGSAVPDETPAPGVTAGKTEVADAITAPDSSGFPSLAGGSSPAARKPWRLPKEPSPSAIAADTSRVGVLEIRAASMVGPGHRSQEPGIPRQDAYRLGQDSLGRHLLIAVADGMSDSRNSHIGANVAVTAVIDRLRTLLNTGHKPTRLKAKDLFLEASRQMVGVAKQRGLTDDEVRTGVLAAVIPVEPDSNGQRIAWFGVVADVSAWLWRPGGWQPLVDTKKPGLDSNSISAFLPYHSDQAVEHVLPLEEGAVLAVTTDGIGDSLGMANIASWFADRWQDPPHIGSFILDVGYEARTQLDDRTAVLVWCDSPAGDR